MGGGREIRFLRNVVDFWTFGGVAGEGGGVSNFTRDGPASPVQGRHRGSGPSASGVVMKCSQS